MSFPNHTHDFQDSVYITTEGKGGLVQAIRQGHTPHQWLYQLTTTGDRWWDEAELSTACPHCLSPIAPRDTRCPTCGTPLIDN
jgi:hypothetical protein